MSDSLNALRAVPEFRPHNLCALLQETRVQLENWLKDFQRRGKQAPRVWCLLKTNLHSREFLKRTQVFLDAPANSQPGV